MPRDGMSRAETVTRAGDREEGLAMEREGVMLLVGVAQGEEGVTREEMIIRRRTERRRRTHKMRRRESLQKKRQLIQETGTSTY